MTQTGDNFMPTGKLLIETGLDVEGDHSWRFELDGMSQMEAIGIIAVVFARYVLHSIGTMKTMDDDEEGEA